MKQNYITREHLLPKFFMIITVLFVLSSSVTKAQIVQVFTNRTTMETYLNDNSIPFLYDDYSTIPDGPLPTGLTLNPGTNFEYFLNAAGGLTNYSLMKANIDETDIVYTFSSNDVYIFGGTFVNLGIADWAELGGPITIILSDASEHIVNPSSLYTFIGIESDIPISSVIIRPANIKYYCAGADDFLIATGHEVPDVPLSNWALGIGLLLISGFIVIRFRKRLA